MPLTLLAGPANAGKVALLLERFRSDLEREPVLIVPNRGDVDRVQRELLAEGGALLAGSIDTFDGVFSRLAAGNGDSRDVLTDAQRSLLVRRLLAEVGPELGGSARFPGYADTLAATLGELEAGLVEPDEVGGDLGALYAAYRAELDRLGVRDRDGERRYGADRAARDLGAWTGSPVYAYGFEDLTGAQWALIESLGRTRRCDGVAPVRAGSHRVRSARANIGGSRTHRRRADRGAAVLRRIALLGRSSPTSSATCTSTSRMPQRRSKALCDSSRLRAPVGCSS